MATNVSSKSVDPDPRITATDKDMLSIVIDRFKASRDWRQPQEDMWQRWDALYTSQAPVKDWPYATSLSIPVIFSTVEAFLPRIVTQRPAIAIVARNPEDTAKAQTHKQLIDYQWELLKMPLKLEDFCRGVLVYGYGWMKLGWETVRQTRKFRIPGGGTGTREVVVKDDPFLDLVPPEDIYPDPTAVDMTDMGWLIHRSKLQLHEIDQLLQDLQVPGRQETVNKLRKQRKSELDAQAEKVERNREALAGTSVFDGGYRDKARMWEFDVLEYWEPTRRAIVVLEPEMFLFQGPNPYWHQRIPFLLAKDNPLPFKLQAMGEPQILDALTMELNEIHNLRLEAAKRGVFPTFVARLGSPITQKAVQWGPQKIIWAGDIDRDIKALYPGGQFAPGYREEDAIRILLQEVSGANDNFKGLGTNAGSETATAATILAQAANSRVGLKFHKLVESVIKPMGEMLISLNEQKIDKERRIEIVGPEAQEATLDPDLLATGGAILDVRVDVGQTDPINKEVSLRKTEEAIGVIAQIPPQVRTDPIISILITRLMESLDLPVTPQTPAQNQTSLTPADTEGPAQGSAPNQSNQSPIGAVADAINPRGGANEGTAG